jgi:hypothetical protein
MASRFPLTVRSLYFAASLQLLNFVPFYLLPVHGATVATAEVCLTVMASCSLTQRFHYVH